MLRFIYNFAGLLGIPFICIYYILYSIIKKRKIYHALQRIGIYKKHLVAPCIHIHGVSLGEAMIGHKLGASLNKDFEILYTTITDSGFKYLNRQEGLNVAAFPLDNYMFVRSFMKNHNIQASLFIETEIWPEFIFQAEQAGVKLYLVNARLSERSFPSYRRMRFFFGPLLNRFERIFLQSASEMPKFAELGVDRAKMLETGNIKYDLSDFQDEKNIEKYRQELGLKSQDIVIVAGSTFEEEEAMLANTYRQLKNDFKDLRMIIAPRHPHRFEDVYSRFSDAGFDTVKREPGPESMESWDILILNTLGELKYVYGAGHIAFVGGSLVRIGGHNILEPAFWSRAIVTGKHYHNFSGIVNDFLVQDAVLIVKDQKELYKSFLRLIEDADYRLYLGQNAKKVLEDNRGALGKTQKAVRDGIIKDIHQV